MTRYHIICKCTTGHCYGISNLQNSALIFGIPLATSFISLRHFHINLQEKGSSKKFGSFEQTLPA